MASKILSTPLLHQINAFDPASMHKFYFTYSGEQVKQVEFNITNNNGQMPSALGTVGKGFVGQENQAWYFILHGLKFATGYSYLIRIKVYDADGNYSDWSNAALFYCFNTPTFEFSNVKSGYTALSPDLDLILTYTYDKGSTGVLEETLKEYEYYLYDDNKVEIYSSDLFYYEDGMIYKIYGLENDREYYVRATGKTEHGMDLDTGYIKIHVQYSKLAANAAFEAINDKDTGCIVLKTNIITVGFEIADKDKYTIENSIINLTNNTLTYMVNVEDDFGLIVKAKALPYGKFLWSTNEYISLHITIIAGKYYAHLAIREKNIKYDIFKPIDLNTGSIVSFLIRRKNNIYDMEIYYE